MLNWVIVTFKNFYLQEIVNKTKTYALQVQEALTYYSLFFFSVTNFDLALGPTRKLKFQIFGSRRRQMRK